MEVARHVLLGIVAAVLGFGVPRGARAQEHVGTSTADEAVEVGMFRITNNSTSRITYHVRWGTGPWKATTVEAGKAHDHWLTYDPKGIPAPEISFNPLIGRSGPSKIYKLSFGRAFLGGFGSGNNNHPRLYHFANAADGQHVGFYNR